MTKHMSDKDQGYFLGAYTTLTGLEFMLSRDEVTVDYVRKLIHTTIVELRNDPEFSQIDTTGPDRLTELALAARENGLEEQFFEALGEDFSDR